MKIAYAGIAQLKDLKELQFLDLNNCQLTPACIDTFSEMPNLRHHFIGLKDWIQVDRDELQSA